MAEWNERERSLLNETESLRRRVTELERCEEDRRRAEETIREHETVFLDLFNATEEAAFLMDQEGIILFANRNAARLYGLPMERLSGTSVYDHIPHDRIVSSKEKVKTVLETRKPVRFEGRLEEKVFENSLYPVIDGGAEVRRVAVYIRDITNRKRAEEALTESEERYRTAIEHSNDAVAIIQGEKNQYVNKRFMEIFGYDNPKDLIGKPIFIIVHPDDLEKVVAINQRRQRGEPVPPRYEFQGITRDGKTIYVEVSAANTFYRGTPVYLVYFRDITERKGAEEALQNERNRFRTLSENAPFGIMMFDERGVFEYINPKFKELFGYRLNEIPNGLEWFRKAFPDPKRRKEAISTWISYLRNTRPGEKVPQTLPVTCKDGSQKIIHFIPVRLVTGEHIVTLEDITQRIQAQEALMRSHEELGQLNRAKSKAMHHISHELKTPLAVVQGNIRILKRKVEGLSIAANLQNTLEALERNLARLFDISTETDEIFRVSRELEAGALLDDLDRFWQRIEGLPDIPPTVQPHLDAVKAWLSQHLSGSVESFQSIDLFPFALEVLEMVKRLSGHRNIRYQSEGKPGLFIHMDPQILQNVVEGLLRNAVENTPDGGTIRLRVEQKRDRVLLHIIDTGIGITEEDQAYIFGGLFHTNETELYSSKKPYDFGAGGKGLDLLRMKVYGQRFGFDLSLTSKRCVYIPTDQDQCPGVISRCPHVENPEECAASGGTTFTVSFPVKTSSHPDQTQKERSRKTP